MIIKHIIKSFLVLYVITMHIKPGLGDSLVRCRASERRALLEIKENLLDEYGRLSSWRSEEEDCCKWRGVRCSNQTGHITLLDLHATDDNKLLRGKLSLSLLELRHLNYLDLSRNDFLGTTIPEFNGLLSELQYLNISNAGFSGTLAFQLRNLSNLQFLDLSDNQLKGSISYGLLQANIPLVHLNLSNNQLESESLGFIGSFCGLHTLDLSANNISGSLPEFFEHLSRCAKNSLEILRLDMNKFYGLLPDFTTFSSLKELVVYDNQLTGSFPKRFGQLSHLVELDVGYNHLEGSLPDFSMLPSLKKLSVVHNKLNGTITESIGNLSNLEILWVSHNHFQGVVTEAHFLKLSRLKQIYLNYNPLALKFKSDWVPPFKLDIIGLRSINLGPRFPGWLRTQSNYMVLDIANGGISDSVPQWFWNLSRTIFYLNISNNLLSGVVPDLSLKFVASPGMDLSSNLFEGSLPLLPSNASSLNLSKNKFVGSISSVCKVIGRELNFLDLSDNLLTGEVPDDCFRNGHQLLILNLAANNLSGKIPASVGSLSVLQSFVLQNNSFSGGIPSSLKNCSWLRFLDLGYNRLSGGIPLWIGERQVLLVFLSLQSNEFNGSIPVQLCWLQNIHLLDLSVNNISGTIPHCFKNFTAMTRENLVNNNLYNHNFSSSTGEGIFFGGIYVDKALIGWKGTAYEYQKNLQLLRIINLAGNKLSGEIPQEITSLTGLVGLNLSRNGLTGMIPEDIGELNYLQWFDLSRNGLSGEIPVSMAKQTFLGYIDIAHNNLSGRIPRSTQLQSFNASVFAGNVELCGLPVTRKCPEDDKTFQDRPANDDSQNKDEDDDDEFWKWFYWGLASGWSVGFGGVVGILAMLPSWRHSSVQFAERARDWFYVKVRIKARVHPRI
ncbi:receptor-like protein EIX2 [Mercurialis annua]|uniref:receptor-like protein EIX2 n=1 Tax=Mercurialis annua TaxID=3986 RepID=UPI0024ACF238|nr:receptor-like protein EIX2 [Mercurialis annua]